MHCGAIKQERERETRKWLVRERDIFLQLPIEIFLTRLHPHTHEMQSAYQEGQHLNRINAKIIKYHVSREDRWL